MEELILKKIKTHIDGFDFITKGGLSQHRTTLVSGTAGCGKTVLAAQFLAEAIMNTDEAGVFVTFEENPEDIKRNMIGFGWDIQKWEDEGKWAFVDVSNDSGIDTTEIGNYDMEGLLLRIKHAVQKTNAKNLSIDSISVIFSRFDNYSITRKEISRIIFELRKLKVTTLLTGERTDEYGGISRYGVEEFVVDNVIVLRNKLETQRRRRTIEVLKLRGADHQKGEWPFTIVPGKGFLILPMSAIELGQESSDERITTGNNVLDEMTGGGYYKDSMILLSGATGTGKTLLVAGFIAATCLQGKKALLMAYEESAQQIIRNAKGWGIDLKSLQESGLLKIVSGYPESATMEEHLAIIKTIIDEFKPVAIAVDSVSAMERVATSDSFREFVISLTCFVKEKGIVCLMTAVSPSLYGGISVTNVNISTISDSIIILRYVQVEGLLSRGVMILKMRGSNHEKNIREFTIDDQGLHIGDPLLGIKEILCETEA